MTTRFDLDGDVLGASTNGHRQVVVTRPRRGWIWWQPGAPRERGERSGNGVSTALLAGAAVLLAILAVTQGYASFHQQFIFDLAAKPGQRLASLYEALGLDAAAVCFAVLGIAQARFGRPARIERVLVALCAMGSCAMNVLGANLGSPRSVAVYVLPAVLFCTTADRLIAVIRRAALGPVADDAERQSAWRVIGMTALYVLRFALAPRSTASGGRRWLIAATPLPAAATAAISAPLLEQSSAPPGRPAARTARAPGAPQAGTKTALFLRLVQDRYGPLNGLDLAKISRIAGELAPEADLHTGSARTALRSAVIDAQARSAE